MMQIRLNREQLKKVHGEIYGLRKSDAPICIQLEKLDRYIQQHSGKGFKPDTFDTFDYV
ncbi:MAG: hypothetical protein QXY22_03845 [Candidatus Nitrosotenuis sp.]|uniref:Uncharacterized protein n=1 Tax=Candidatus Nitrosotenuis uzonensis TaxID=1407055 RepID=V6ARX2_9ARCH|nr:hypothetical protein [Candidatus Nitrosotenuis uzonensis]CAE6501349.1 conserved hypothetical protein [Candidatus Nitrosotenuis uzonensis]CDI05412.1 hypothetical protein NITUZ_30104 [Candidatus Nitrosotenuis uzonensis]